MDLLYISDFKFSIKYNKILSLSAYSDAFWQKYLDVFSKIHVVGVLEQKNTKGMIAGEIAEPATEPRPVV